jgi:hypothetical protein
LVLVYEDGAGFISHYYLMDRDARDQDVVVDQTQIAQGKHGGKIKQASFDRGFHSKENEASLGEIVADVCVLPRHPGQYAERIKQGTVTFHKTRLSLTGALPAIAGGAALGIGRLIYTFPAGVIRIISAYFDGVAITQTDGNIDDDTPDVGLGTVIASDAVSVLSGTATFESVLTGQTFADCDGTATSAGAASTLIIDASDAHTLYFNVAATWSASGDAAAAISGDVVITWEFLG